VKETARVRPLTGAKEPSIRVSPSSSVSILVHCHLRWDFVWQRPQQILSRLAAHHAILVLEEPVADDGPARLEVSEPAKNIVRVVPHLPGAESMPVESRCETVLALLTDALRVEPALQGRFKSVVQWFYSPLTAPFFLDRLPSVGIVYDCMDELANFRFAASDIAKREQLLLSRADVVFTGGYSLYESKSKQNPNTHFFGCGVDVSHFGKARLETTRVPPEVAQLPRPILGYFGVIDERLDYSLVAHLADTFSEASVVMVGPVAKVDPATLPKRANIHWLGQRAYGDLPALVKAFDVCLMPFALNEATQYINPTKTLEYMAAAKPIVSTAVPDVIRNFTPVVQVAHSEHEFAEAVAKALEEPDEQLIDEGLACSADASWEAIVAAMRKHMLRAVGAGMTSVDTAVDTSRSASTLLPSLAAKKPNPGRPSNSKSLVQ
jgi:glycosyltransferase involved in cell wall biosynthesis